MTRFHIRMKFVSPAYLGLGIRKIIILLCIHAEALPCTGGTRIPRLIGVRNYLNHDFDTYTRLTHSLIRVEFAFPAYLG